MDDYDDAPTFTEIQANDSYKALAKYEYFDERSFE
ncbi:hypothetical protein L195_g010247, partial [Trifolium pratense]